jgi:opacity protein-like surface antigen
MKAGVIGLFAVGCCALSLAVNAQNRDTGWEFGADVTYQTSKDVDIETTDISFDDDIGLSLYAGYRMNSQLEFQFGIDWNTVDYQASFPGVNPGVELTVDTELEAITPFAKANYNFVDGPITPYVTAGIGWAFIDTNIPNGPPTTGCWWDPWWGYICDTFQSTHSTDSFTYEAGLGVRWDVAPGYSLRLAYEKHWYDGDADTTDFDRFRLGIVFRY